MKNLKDKIMEGGFFKNTGLDMQAWRDWFNNVPVFFEQYLTQYDNKNIIKDDKKFTITFLNKYKKFNDQRNVYLNLAPYMSELVKYDPRNIVIKFTTGLFSGSKNVETKINNRDKYDQAIEKRGWGWDKHIRIYITAYPGDNPKYGQDIINGTDVNKMTNTRHDPRLSYAGNARKREASAKILLTLSQYCDDFPHSIESWTEMYNGLK